MTSRSEKIIDCKCGHQDFEINVHNITIVDGIHSHAPYATATVCNDCFLELKILCGLTKKDFEEEE